MKQKLEALVKSRRFWAAITALAIVLTDGLGINISEEQVTAVVAIAATWIIGDTVRKTE